MRAAARDGYKPAVKPVITPADAPSAPPSRPNNELSVGNSAPIRAREEPIPGKFV